MTVIIIMMVVLIVIITIVSLASRGVTRKPRKYADDTSTT